MKKLFSGAKPIYQIVALDIFGGIMINAILQSNILENSKISLSIIIGIIVAVFIINIYYKSFKEQQTEIVEKMDAKFEEYFVKLKELADQNDDVTAEHCKTLEEKIKELENNTACFPLAVAKDYDIYSIIQKAYKPFYDSDWIISGQHGNELFACHITRTDEETAQGLMTLIRETQSVDDIWALDQYDEIYPEEVNVT